MRCRIHLALLALLSLAHIVCTQTAAHDIYCNFRFVGENYFCSLDDVTIITETVPLRFFNVHLPNQNDSTVSGLSTFDMWPRNINIRVVHPQLMQQFPNLRFLHLGQSAIETLLTDTFQQCDQLTVLTLSQNRLTSIPPRVFQNCTNLRALDMSGNQLSQVDGESFYGLQNLVSLQMGRSTILNNTFEHLAMLQYLTLSGTQSIESNALRHLGRLEGIEIAQNSLSLNVVQDAIDGMKGLDTIMLLQNGYTSFDFGFFEQFEALLDFDLSVNALTTIPGSSFRNYSNLLALRLHSNQISAITEETFAGLLKLNTLTLNNNRLSRLSANCFADLGNLRSLDLSDNIIPQIDPGAFNGLQSLESLYLNNVELATLIPEMLDPLRNLQRLEIVGGRITSIPANTFTATENLRHLLLIDNMITRLNSNSFGRLPLLDTFLIGHSVWNEGLREIERNLFENFPSITRFGGSENVCFRGTIDMTQVDFDAETVFEECFSNWEASGTTTTEISTTPYSEGVVVSGKLWLLAMALVCIILCK